MKNMWNYVMLDNNHNIRLDLDELPAGSSVTFGWLIDVLLHDWAAGDEKVIVVLRRPQHLKVYLHLDIDKLVITQLFKFDSRAFISGEVHRLIFTQEKDDWEEIEGYVDPPTSFELFRAGYTTIKKCAKLTLEESNDPAKFDQNLFDYSGFKNLLKYNGYEPKF